MRRLLSLGEDPCAPRPIHAAAKITHYEDNGNEICYPDNKQTTPFMLGLLIRNDKSSSLLHLLWKRLQNTRHNVPEGPFDFDGMTSEQFGSYLE